MVSFLLFLEILGWLGPQRTGVDVRSSTLELDTGTGEVRYHLQFDPLFLESHYHLIVGEEGELEEDVEQELSCLEGVFEVE